MTVSAVVGVLLVVVMGCEEDITVVVGTDLPYSLYGVISPQLDSQWVRVYPIEGRLTPTEPEPLDATMTSTNLTTGEEIAWRDSVILDFSNQYAHVFWAPFQAQYDHTYRIDVQRSDGAETFVQVTVPPRSEILIETPQIRIGDVLLPVFVEGDLPRVVGVTVEYAVAYLPFEIGDIITNRFTIPYYTEPNETEGGWRININLREDFEEVRSTIASRGESLDGRVGIILLNTTIDLIVGNEEWNPPNGIFDPNLLVQPGIMTNVMSGFGFVGAGYRLSRRWIPPRDAIMASGFRPPEEVD
jgi:hypothetical protein